MFFWVLTRRQIVFCRRFGTLCQVHLQRLDVEYAVKSRNQESSTGLRKSLFRLRMLDEVNAVAQWLRHCATNRMVAGSIPDGVIGIVH
jgi:hypothetical protein